MLPRISPSKLDVSYLVSHKGFHGDSVYDWGPPGRLEEEGGLAPEDVRHHYRPCPVSPGDKTLGHHQQVRAFNLHVRRPFQIRKVQAGKELRGKGF